MKAGPIAAKRARAAWALLAGTCAALLGIAGYPLFKTIFYSFTDARLDELSLAGWVGLENYAYLLQDDLWWRAVRKTLQFTMVSVSLELALGLAIALALTQPFPLRSLVRALVLVPWAIPTVVSTRIWEWLYNDQYGLINYVLVGCGLLAAPAAFLADPSLQFYSAIMVDVWKTTPFMVLLLMAGLAGIQDDVKEAARVDGATSWQVFRRVTLPLLKPTILVALTFRALDALRVFDIIYVLFGGNEKTSTISIYARTQMIDFQEMGLGSAASVLIFLLIGVFILLQSLMLREEKGGA